MAAESQTDNLHGLPVKRESAGIEVDETVTVAQSRIPGDIQCHRGSKAVVSTGEVYGHARGLEDEAAPGMTRRGSRSHSTDSGARKRARFDEVG